MSVGNIRSPIDIAVSGLRAQAIRMNVIAGNIANSGTMRTASGQPYRRKTVVLSTDEGDNGLAGVRIDQIMSDLQTDFKRIYQPGSPDADEKGFIQMPNVELPVEMMNLATASRAYQASAAVLKRYQEMTDLTLELLR